MKQPIVYTISTCPASIRLKKELAEKGIAFEERQVDKDQAWLDEALKFTDSVPTVVWEDGRIEVGYPGMMS